ncbi:tetratricopeptide repeat protein [Rheinheimera sp.]|uniref:tetratricopeptide repeat protein n=1 Tax=Rheinheimera sp. TaxID=1869214 RepID=UPI0025E0314E|nr:tetratricopeptide repeat protein [Rheinheimera sp.]
MKLNKLTSALVVFATIGAISLPINSAFAAPDPAKIAERKARKSQAVGEKVGKAIGKAYELYSADQISEAIAVLSGIEPTAAFDKAYLYKFLGTLYAEKDPAKSLNMLTQAAKLDVLSFNDQAQLYRTIADLNLGAKKYQEALNNYNKWMDFTGETNPDVYMRIANCYYEMKQYNKVIAPADAAIALMKTPKKDPYIMKLGAYYENKQIKKAIEVLETMVVVFPDDKQWWVQLGNFYNLDEQYGKALAAVDLAYKQGYLKTENEIKLLANLYNNNNIPHRAAALLEKHMKAGLLKKDRSVLSSIASSYNSSRDFDKAAFYYGELAKLENDGETYRRQGLSYLMAGKQPEAISALQKALEVGVKDKGKVHTALIEAYFYQSKLKEAYRHVELARANGQEKVANSWGPYIRERASKKGITL